MTHFLTNSLGNGKSKSAHFGTWLLHPPHLAFAHARTRTYTDIQVACGGEKPQNMGDTCASKLLKEEIPDEEGNRSLQNLEVGKLGHNQAMDLQSSSGVGAEPAGVEKTCIVGTHEAHGKKPNKKPDKPLPCPRCESFDTKFCYFNNYNVNQPRHFCRKCQRYWTAGGLLRNVPRGAGRRRSKYNTTHQKHVVLSNAKALGCDAYDMVPSRSSSKHDAKKGFLHTQKTLFPSDVGLLVSEDGLSASSTMLSFDQRRPLCEVMAAHSLSVQHSNMSKGSFNEWCPSQRLEHEGNDMHASTSINCVEAASIPTTFEHIHGLPKGLGMVPHYSQEKDRNVSSSSILETQNNGTEKQEENGENLSLHYRSWHHFDAAKDSPTSTSASHCSGIPQLNFSSMKGSSIVTPSNYTSTHDGYDDSAKGKAMPTASDCAKASESTLLTTTWNGLPGAMWAHPPWLFMPSGPLAWDWAKAYWHMPWFLAALASSTSTRRPGLQNRQTGSEDEGCLWVPKTLRIDDPVEAAQSSIWKTLGLDKAPGSSALQENTKQAFHGQAGAHEVEESSTHSHHSNPAALSRSLTFNETT